MKPLSEKSQIALIEALANQKDGVEQDLKATATQIVGEITENLQELLSEAAVPRIPAVGVALLLMGVAIMKDYEISKDLALSLVNTGFEEGGDGDLGGGRNQELTTRGN